MSRYDADDTYCISGTAVLKNKAEITDQDLLDQYEADFTTVRIIELSQTPIIGNFDLNHLCKIHEYVFGDVYDWAGKIRTVDISRGNSRFCNVMQIASYSQSIFSALKNENCLMGLSLPSVSARLAHYLSEINAIHPFREGNGRVQRVFISQLAAHSGHSLDYSTLNQAEVYQVMQASFLGDEKPLADLILKIIA